MSLVVNRIFKTWRTGHSNKKAASENKRLQSGSTGYSHQSKTEGISRHRAVSLISSDNPPFAAAPSISWSYCSYEYEESISLLAITLSNDDSPPENIEFNAVVFPSEASERLPRRAASLAPQASLTPRSLLTPPAYSALYAALTANTERFGQPYQYAIPPLPTNGLPRRLSSAAYDSASSVLPSPTWPTPPHTPSKLLTEPAPLLLPPPLSSAASPIRASPRANPRRLSNASARFSQRVSLASAYSLSRPPSSARLQSQQVSVRLATAPARKSAVSLVPADDILGEGDVVGDSVVLHNELVMAIDHGRDPLHGGPQNGAQARYEIVKKLGSGSYATVFLAREILAEPVPPNDTDLPFEWNGSDDVHADPDVTICTPGPSIAAAGRTYGRPFAIKCLSRASLTTPESLAVQMLEATLHRSLPVHPNVVSLHAALESLSCLFLVLEYVRGPDLFYFLEQSQDALPPPLLVEEHEFTPRAPSYAPEPTHSGRHTHTALHSAPTPPTPSLLSALASFILSPARLRLIASMFQQMCGAVASCHARRVSHRDIKPENFIVTDAWVPVGTGDGRKQRKVVVKLSDFGLATNEAESSDIDCGSAPYMSHECRNNCAPTYDPRAADVWSLGIVLINISDRLLPRPIRGMTHAVAHFLATRVFCIPDANRIDATGFGEWVKNLTAHFDDGAMGQFEGSVPVTPVMGPAVLGGFPVQRAELIDIEGAREALESGLGLTGVDGEGEAEVKEEVLRTTTSGARKRGAQKNKNSAPPTEPSTPVLPIPTIFGDYPAAKVQDLARELSKQSAPSRTPSVNPPVPEPRLVKKPTKWSLFRVRNNSSSGSGRASGLGSVNDTASEAGSTPTVMSLLGSFEAAGPLTPRVSAPPATAALPPVRAYAHPHAGHKPSPLGPASVEARGRTKLTAPGNQWGSSPIGQFGTHVWGKSPVAPARNPAVPAFAALALGSVPAPVPAPQPRVYERVSVGESSNWRQSTSTVSTSFPHGVPWEVDALPRQAFPRGPDGRPLQGHIHGAPRNKPPRRWTRHDQRTPSYLPPRRR